MRREDFLSRRDFIKLLGLSAGMPLVANTQKNENDNTQVNGKKAKIVIIGGGPAAIITATRLRKKLYNTTITLIFPNQNHIYYPSFVPLSTGIKESATVYKGSLEVIPKGVDWIRDSVVEIEPTKNRLKTKANNSIEYDFLVVATGNEYDYRKVRGLWPKMVGKYNIASLFIDDDENIDRGAKLSLEWMKMVKNRAKELKKGEKIDVIYALHSTFNSCPSVPLKYAYLTQDYFRGNGPSLAKGVDFSEGLNSIYFSGKKNICKFKNVQDYLIKEVNPLYETLSFEMNKDITEIDPFKKYILLKDEKGKIVKQNYDYLFVTPPQRAVKCVRDSELGLAKGELKGYLECDSFTLNHKKFTNVFGVGDILGLANQKGISSIRYQSRVVEKNLVSMITGQEMIDRYDGKSTCYLATKYGRDIKIESDYSQKFLSSHPNSSWISWLADSYLSDTVYWQLVLKGIL